MKRQGTVRLSNLSKSGRVRIHTRTSLFQETVLIKYNLLSNITLPPTPHLVQSAHTCHTAALGWGRPLFHLKPLSTFTFLFSPPAKGGRLPSISPGPNGSCPALPPPADRLLFHIFNPIPLAPSPAPPMNAAPIPFSLGQTTPTLSHLHLPAQPPQVLKGRLILPLKPPPSPVSAPRDLKPGTSPTSQEAPWCGLRCLFLLKLLPC